MLNKETMHNQKNLIHIDEANSSDIWDNLLSKGWEGPSFLCTKGPESISHLLIINQLLLH